MLKKIKVNQQTPNEIVKEMNKYIIGQYEAKKAVAIAFVNRRRRMMIDDEKMRSEILPKNVLLSGPTGVGKTEIARRVADITDSPFLKVEMTKFTEVGYAGKDVESIIRDLVDLTIKRERDKMIKNYENTAKKMAIKYVAKAIQDFVKTEKNDRNTDILKSIIIADKEFKNDQDKIDGCLDVDDKISNFIAVDEIKLANGEYDDIDITITLPDHNTKKDIFNDLGGNYHGNISEIAMISIVPFSGFKNEKNKVQKTIKVREALEIMYDYYMENYVDKNLIIADVIKKIEQSGVIFLDEIDKLISNKDYQSRGEVSREGVQRDLLAIVEGTIVQTKYGSVKTDHILFIAAGAFCYNKVSDLMPELQGRFPVCVELKPLTVNEFERILTDLKYSLPEQQQKLLKVDGIDVLFTRNGLKAIAQITSRLNSELENTGARRLFSVIEKVIEEVSFSGSNGTKLIIDRKYVEKMTSNGFDKKVNTRKYMI